MEHDGERTAAATATCRYFMRGHCRDGARCAFAHRGGGGHHRRVEEEEKDDMECSSSGEDEAEEQAAGELMDVEGSSRSQEGQQEQLEHNQTRVVPYARAGVLSRLLAPLHGGLGPAQLLTIPAFELRREALERSSGGYRRVRIVCISDTHMKHTFLTPFMPQGDDHILLHAGDFTSLGREEHALQFNEWLGTLNYRHKFIVSGNHERVCGDVREHESYARLLTNGTYVTHGCITLEEFGGLTIFLSSWERKYRDHTSAEPELFPWDDPVLSAGNDDEHQHGGDGERPVRRGVDVLVTHMPPRGILDTVRVVKHRGSAQLLARVTQIRPTVHVFGHAHRSGVEVHEGGTTFVNVANPGRAGPIVFDYYYSN